VNNSVVASGANVIVGVQNSILNDSPTGLANFGGQSISVGPSNLVTGAGSFTATVPFQ
jgi:hypothetical protein